MLWIIFCLLGGGLTFGVIRKQQFRLPTAWGAFIMAAGIFINVLEKQKFIPSFGMMVPILLLTSLMIGFALAILHEAISGIVYHRHLSDPISSFAAGTWVAAFSLITITIARWLPDMRLLAILFYSLNSLLWMGFLILAFRNFLHIWKRIDKRKQVNGVIFLSCVATQSVAVATAVLFGKEQFFPVLQILVTIGCVFYLFSFVTLVVRLLQFNWSNLAEEWANTNCIIHGALSITGLAGVYTSFLSIGKLGLIWLISAFLFAVVEGIELVRMYQRIKRFGWKRALFTYHSSQWARNFTFGMFLAFTLNMPWQQCYFCDYSLWNVWKNIWLQVGTPVLFLLFTVELGLFANQILNSIRKPAGHVDHNLQMKEL